MSDIMIDILSDTKYIFKNLIEMSDKNIIIKECQTKQ